jgi:GTP pyrophosphokinase
VRPLTQTFDEAVLYALEAHADQVRKGTTIAYASHLLAVASIVLEDGGDEATAIAALLHDVIEDQDHDGSRYDDIRARFGPDVADAVRECSAEAKTATDEWLPRKESYIAYMSAATAMALQVSLADKVHNLRCIVDDYRRVGDRLWPRFNAPGADAVIWYYQSLIDVYEQRREELNPIRVLELRRLVGHLRSLLQRPDCVECGAGDVVPVIIGMPGPELMEAEAAGEVVLAGCIVMPDQPNWACRICGHEWLDATREHDW